MDSKIKELTDKTYHEGVEKGSQEAAQILAKAKQQGDDTIATAQAEVQRIASDAQRQTVDLAKNTQSELKLYAEQVVSSTQSVTADNLTDRIIRGNAQAVTTDVDFMQKLVLVIVQQRTVGGPMAIGTANAEALERHMFGNAKALLDSGQVTTRTGAAQGTGFSVAPADGSYKANFGGEELVNFFKDFLCPRLAKELLRGKLIYKA